jgi:ABC-2 type transport system permease protein
VTAHTAPGGRSSVGARRSRPVWTLVLTQELRELWVGGRALNLLVLFTVLMSGTAFLLATNTELSLATPRLAMVTMLQSAITFGLFIGLIVAAESVSGERERATLEPLLLTPADRRQVVLGKYVAALSPWPAALVLAIPYIVVLAQGDVALDIALVWGAVLGTLMVASFAGIGLLASIWSGSSRSSLFIALLIYLLALLPAQLPGEFVASPAGAAVQALVPLESVRQFLNQYLLDGVALDDARLLLIAPTVALVAILVVLFGVAAPRLGLDGASWPVGRWASGKASE